MRILSSGVYAACCCAVGMFIGCSDSSDNGVSGENSNLSSVTDDFGRSLQRGIRQRLPECKGVPRAQSKALQAGIRTEVFLRESSKGTPLVHMQIPVLARVPLFILHPQILQTR